MAYLPTSHSALTNLGADDHTQYHNDTRGNARYPRKTGTGSGGTWPIAITGNAASAASATNAAMTGNGDFAMDWERGYPPYGFHFAWGDPGVLTYLWVCDDNANVYLCWEGYYSRAGHNHDGIYGAQWGSNHVDVGNMAANTGYGPWVWGHGMGISPRTVMPTPTYDDNVNSCVASIGNLWDATNVAMCGRNVGPNDEAVALGFIAWS